MKESRIMLLHYITGLGILVTGAIHLALIFFLGSYDQNLAFDGSELATISIYRNFAFALILEALLIFVAFHAFNGLRVILMEARQGRKWESGVNWVLTFMALFFVIYGTRTILLARLI